MNRPRILKEVKMKQLYILCAFLCFYLQSIEVKCNPFTAEFHSKYKVPASVPSDPTKLVYHVPVGHPMRRIIVNMKKLSKQFYGGFGDTFVSSFDVNHANESFNDTWAETGGYIGMFGLNSPFPYYYSHLGRRMYSSPTTTLKLTMFYGELLVENLVHYHPNMTKPPNPRIVSVNVRAAGQNIVIESEPIEFSDSIDRIAVVDFPSTVVANKPFNVSAELLTANGSRLTEGADSVLGVILRIAHIEGLTSMIWDYNVGQIALEEPVRLDGENIYMDLSSKVKASMKRATNGFVEFPNIRLLDVHSCVRLNFTSRSMEFPYPRMPFKTDDDKWVVKFNTSENYKGFYLDADHLNNGVVLTDCINVTAQTATTLVIKTQPAARLAANFPTEPAIVIEIQDADGDRVYSGPDSKLVISVYADPSNAVLCNDSMSVEASDGIAVFEGSFCEPIASVKLRFEATSSVNGSELTSVESTLMEITNELHIAFFGDVNVTGRSTYGPNSQAIIRLLVDKVNAGAHPFLAGILPGRKVFLSTYNTKLDRELTGSNFIKMIDKGKADPSQKVRAVIGFGQDDVSTSLQFLLKEYKMPLFTTIETNPIFSDKILFPYSNRMSFNYKNTVGYIMRLFRLRNWKKIVVLTTDTFYIDASFYKTCQDQDIEVADTVSIPTLDPSEMVPGAVDNYLKRVKNANTTIIVYMMIRPLTSYLFFETYRYHMSTLHGYQTSFAGDEVGTNGVPWINEDSVCFQGNMSCSLILTGMFAAYSYSNISAFLTPEWMWTLSNYIRMDPWDMYGIGRNFPPSSVFGLMSRAPDACRTIMLAVDKLIKENATITPEKMAITPRQMDAFTGLTGEIKFDEYGDRLGFLGEISTIYPYPWALNHVRMFAYSPYAVYYPYGVDDILEIRREVLIYWKSLGFSLQPKSYAWAAENHRNMRNYTTSTGIIKDYTFKLGEYGGQPLEIVTKNETVPAPFWCDQGCGGGDPDPFDITIYPYGTCENLNICRCKDGYFGYDCSQLICSCAHGHCDVPYVCICDEGYEGVKCETAICKTVNCGEHGTCSSPEVCICDSGYMGKNCDTLIVAVALGALFGSIAFIAIVVFIVFKIVKRMQLKAALSNLDWLVKWDEVMIGDARALSYLSTAADELMQSNKSNIVTWRSQKCFVQKFHCDNLELQDPLLRLEVVFMKELRHNNILTFVGACLDFPYVCVLTEVAPKGSLEDVLHNETINLGWDFRFSLLKDICRGMEFLHNSNIGSHGRLKTTNCLIDNRWTCKIGGYGVPTWRYKGPRRTIPNEEVTHRESELFWTAPELLTSNVHVLDDVQNGTKAGDIYSFSVIMSEMCTREEPFSNELGFLTAQDIMKLLINKDSPEAADAKRLWYKSGGDTTKLFRPRVADDHLPTEYAAKTGMLKLFEMLWAANPSVRPTFRQTLDKLNEIYPIKGELIDNLINMLEKYSSNLEQIVAERTRDLVAEKAKTEQLLSQILPKKVMEDLKHGKPVVPESFECVTIYFSDIVGFTKIAGGSTPLQIVDLLNDLYTTFDAILDNYDVYKVETIGDAYMVVSGLPIRNGDLHAGEIATMSLDLLAAIGSFRIRHMPETTLQLRIGMHSGSCVAGVVGLKMPRYCLFGDTVNTASRMESNSMALRIHLSEPCFKILESLGGYHLVYRGQIEAKGKGKMTTYWLHGKDGFEKKLPDMTLAASASQHEFK